jgi:NTE family protein
MGLASNERLEDFLGWFSSARYFHEMKIPLAIVATDLLTGKSVHFTEGEIGLALLASCAYPGLFLPIEYRGHCLVDGFLTETVPPTAVREMGAKVVIAVHRDPRLLSGKPGNSLEVINRSFAIIQTSASQPWRDATDVLIEPNVRDIFWDDFVKMPHLVSAGGNAAKVALPRIRATLVRRVSRPLRVRTRSHIPKL